MISSVSSQHAGADVYTDLSSVQSIRQLKDKNLALEKVAEQFESMMMRMMLKSMRSANEVFAEGNYLSSKETDTYRDMLDDQLSLELSKGGGMGLAEVMVRQLQSRYGNREETESENKAATQSVSGYLENRLPAMGDAGAVNAPARTDDNMAFDGSVQQFVDQVYPLAEKAAQSLGVSPEVLIAQSALETGWGRRMTGAADGASSLNFFNIKASRDWQGNAVTVPTLEIRDGRPVRELGAFRAYASPADSFDDYVDFVGNSDRYQQAVQSGDDETYIRSLADAGYATDTAYAEKVIRIMNSPDLQAAVAHTAGEPADEG